MKSPRQTARFFAMWSKEATQNVYYHIGGREFIAYVTKGDWYTGQPRKNWESLAMCIGLGFDRVARKAIAESARAMRIQAK